MEASSSNGAIKSTSGAGGKPDLFVMERENINWRSPNLYAEFKFLYCDDIDESGAFCSQPNYNEVLQDTRKLFTFSEISPNTTCVQGVYFCRNLERDAKAYPPKKHGAQEAQHENFVSYFKTEAIKLLGQSCEIPFNSVLELSARTGDSNRDFWLDLVLFEIRRR